MNIYSKIKYDHDKIIRLIDNIERMGRKKSSLRAPLFNKLKKEILILHKAEEQTLYEELEDHKKIEDLVETLKGENETIESVLKRMENLKINSKK